MKQITYLELAQTSGSAHKFYEVVVKDTEVTIRYGRIGDKGRVQTKTYPTADKAKAEANKKIREKLRKGYEEAVMGIRQKRPITRRQVDSSKSTAQQAPVLWKFNSDSSAFGIFIDQDLCWLGNSSGKVFAINHQGEFVNQFQLPNGVKCLVADDMWIYAGCDDGNVYDLTGKVPRIAYEIDENLDIYWLDIYDGLLCVSDANGGLTTINHEQEIQWTRLSRGQSAWMVRCDHHGIYQGHDAGVTMYNKVEGKMLWHQDTKGSILFGWQESSSIYAGTSSKKIYAFGKDGSQGNIYQCDAPVYSCATAVGGKYVFAGDNSSSIYCFNQAGERLWKLGTGCSSALSMQFLDGKIYIVTTDGSLACIDASESAIAAAKVGNLPSTQKIKPPKSEFATLSNTLESTTDRNNGVILECVKVGSKLRIKVASPGYHSDWNVQFPKHLRQEGQFYWVEEIKESASGNFYRVYGDIKKLILSTF